MLLPRFLIVLDYGCDNYLFLNPSVFGCISFVIFSPDMVLFAPFQFLGFQSPYSTVTQQCSPCGILFRTSLVLFLPKHFIIGNLIKIRVYCPYFIYFNIFAEIISALMYHSGPIQALNRLFYFIVGALAGKVSNHLRGNYKLVLLVQRFKATKTSFWLFGREVKKSRMETKECKIKKIMNVLYKKYNEV